MEKSQNLEEVICGLKSKTKLPKHAIPVPEEDIVSGVPKSYCCDARRDECEYCITHENRSYCNYKS